MTWKLFTFSLFILTICQKLLIFLHEVPWIPKIQNLYFLMGWMGVLCYLSIFQMLSQPSLDAQSVLFRFLLSHLWVFTPTFMMIYPCFYDEVVEYRLNHHEYSFDFVSGVDWSTFLPRIQNFQARKILVSSRENFMLDTRTNYIPYEKQVHSSKEWSVFS